LTVIEYDTDEVDPAAIVGSTVLMVALTPRLILLGVFFISHPQEYPAPAEAGARAMIKNANMAKTNTPIDLTDLFRFIFPLSPSISDGIGSCHYHLR
jgi:hypothetical protein